MSVLSMNFNAKVRTFFEYPNFLDKKIHKFLYFVCKWLKINILQRQKNHTVKTTKTGKRTGKYREF